MMALEECHARGFLWKATGMCDQQKRDLNKCFMEERKARTKARLAVAKENRKKLEETWADWEKDI